MVATRINEWPRGMLYGVATLSALAALIHLWVAPEHFGEWWGYGTFFLLAASAQLLYAVLLLLRPNRTVLLLGIIGNSAMIFLWLLTRVVGIPLFGLRGGHRRRARWAALVASCAGETGPYRVALLGDLAVGRAPPAPIVALPFALACLFLAVGPLAERPEGCPEHRPQGEQGA